MTEIPDHLLRRAQQGRVRIPDHLLARSQQRAEALAGQIVSQIRFARIQTNLCSACDRTASWITKHGPIEYLHGPCHTNLKPDDQ